MASTRRYRRWRKPVPYRIYQRSMFAPLWLQYSSEENGAFCLVPVFISNTRFQYILPTNSVMFRMMAYDEGAGRGEIARTNREILRHPATMFSIFLLEGRTVVALFSILESSKKYHFFFCLMATVYSVPYFLFGSIRSEAL